MWYRTGQVAKEIGVRPFVVLFWQKTFGIQEPRRTRHNDRLFTPAQVDTFRKIKALKPYMTLPGLQVLLELAPDLMEQFVERIEEKSAG